MLNYVTLLVKSENDISPRAAEKGERDLASSTVCNVGHQLQHLRHLLEQKRMAVGEAIGKHPHMSAPLVYDQVTNQLLNECGHHTRGEHLRVRLKLYFCNHLVQIMILCLI